MNKDNYIIKYLPLFEDDLNEIIDYILFKLRNPVAASNLVNKIEHAIIKRANSPTSFETFISKKYRKDIYYKIHVNNFIIYYIVKNNTMEIRRILYDKRNLNTLL